MSSYVAVPHELSPVQAAAIDALVTSRTLKEAAETAGVTRQTLYTWMQSDPAFRAAYRSVREAAFANVGHGLLALGDRAVEAYSEILRAPNMPGSYTLAKTADSILSQMFKLRELMDVDERLAAIEDRLREVDHDF